MITYRTGAHRSPEPPPTVAVTLARAGVAATLAGLVALTGGVAAGVGERTVVGRPIALDVGTARAVVHDDDPARGAARCRELLAAVTGGRVECAVAGTAMAPDTAAAVRAAEHWTAP